MERRGRWKQILEDILLTGTIDEVIQQLQDVKEKYPNINLHIDSDRDNNLYVIDYDALIKNQRKYYKAKEKDEEKEERALLQRLKSKYEK